MSELQLNLARKWRSKSFNDVIGQELVIRLLKNSLYRNILLPVYLLAGMRGCGKTSVGRLFAAALNCEKLVQFRENPQEITVPCWQCTSCKAIKMGQHPDFIEIDAASHTGVDNIRNLIDIASFVPVMGTKKIYLIDEAHMLSKAAFNALLKILEEPPHSVVFMLATTDSHKVPDTVRSRCFQLFFKPIPSPELIQHIASICTQESIAYEQAGLELVAQESEGSVRDALNLIERIRLSHTEISQETVSHVLGFLDDTRFIDLFEACISSKPATVLQLCSAYNLSSYNALLLWKKLITLLRAALLIKNRLPTDTYNTHYERIAKIIETCSFKQLLSYLEICYAHELAFVRTALPYPLFEMLLVKLSQQNTQTEILSLSDEKKKIISEPISHNTDSQVVKTIEITDARWQAFISELISREEHLLVSIFKQAKFLNFDEQKHTVSVQFAQNVTFFKEVADGAQIVWKPVLVRIFGASALLHMHFDGPIKQNTMHHAQATQKAKTDVKTEVKPEANQKANTQGQKFPTQKYMSNSQAKPREAAVSITDAEKWPKAQLISKIFPGTLTHIKT